MEFLVKNGVPLKENGISCTNANGRHTYYLCESPKNIKKLNKYREIIIL